MSAFSIEHSKEDMVDVVSINGILNADTSPQLDELLQSLGTIETPLILCDVANLTYISSAGVGCFFGVIKTVRAKGGDVRFANMQPKVKRVFKLLDMEDFFKFFSSTGEGIASLNE